MNAAIVGELFGAFIGFGLVSRLFLWISKRSGDTARRIALVDSGTLAMSGSLWWLNGDGDPARWVNHVWPYALAFLAWMVIDLVALKGRRSRAAGRL